MIGEAITPEPRKVLVIDDQRIFRFGYDPNLHVEHYTNAHEGLLALYSAQPWDKVYLDHDLGSDSKMSGSDMARHIAQFRPEVRLFVCHSMNPVGRLYMLNTLLDAGYNATQLILTKDNIGWYLDTQAMKDKERDPFLAGETK
jgi:CheY-like chemotaxis protein